MNLESMVRRLEQQLAAFEQLHTDEIRGLEEKLAAYRRLHADETKMLKEELAALKKELADREVNEPSAAPVSPQSQNRPALNSAAEPVAQLTRREFLGGGGNPHQS